MVRAKDVVSFLLCFSKVSNNFIFLYLFPISNIKSFIAVDSLISLCRSFIYFSLDLELDWDRTDKRLVLVWMEDCII